MAELPAMPLYTDAYLGDTGHLTTIEHGAYMLLLMTMWRAGGSLPNDDVRLARYAKMTPGQWARVRTTILEFFRVEGDHLIQGRLTDTLNAVRQRSRSQSDNARAKWRKTKASVDATASAETDFGSPSKTKTKTKDLPSEDTPPTPQEGRRTRAASRSGSEAKDRLFHDEFWPRVLDLYGRLGASPGSKQDAKNRWDRKLSLDECENATLLLPTFEREILEARKGFPDRKPCDACRYLWGQHGPGPWKAHEHKVRSRHDLERQGVDGGVAEAGGTISPAPTAEAHGVSAGDRPADARDCQREDRRLPRAAEEPVPGVDAASEARPGAARGMGSLLDALRAPGQLLQKVPHRDAGAPDRFHAGGAAALAEPDDRREGGRQPWLAYSAPRRAAGGS